MRRIVSLLTLAVLAVAVPGVAHAETPDPFPAGACVRITFIDDRPICVIVDPLF